MLHPSYSELMAIANSGVEEGEQPIVQSRYSIVKATAQRAKQIIDARAIEERLDKFPEKEKDKADEVVTEDDEYKLMLGKTEVPKSDNIKPLSLAVDEINKGYVKILAGSSDVSERTV